MRNFNNWIKSMLIQEYVTKLQSGGTSGLKVLDLGCGKGGDLLKWSKSRTDHVVGLDIAETSIQQAKERYEKMKVAYLMASFKRGTLKGYVRKIRKKVTGKNKLGGFTTYTLYRVSIVYFSLSGWNNRCHYLLSVQYLIDASALEIPSQ